jgi:hypothetical protein
MEKYLKISQITFSLSVIFIILALCSTLFLDGVALLQVFAVFMLYPSMVLSYNLALEIREIIFKKS